MSHLQNLLLDTLLGTKHVDSAALIKLHERSLCVTSPGFSVMPSDVRTLVNGFAKNPLITRREGLYFKEKDYKCVRADDYSLYAKNENTGVIVVKTHQYLLVATYTAGMYPSVCVEATEKLVFLNNMLAVHFDQPGGPENLYLKEVAKPSPGEGEVLLKVAASALNRADLLQRLGQYAPPPGASSILGLEASGHVAELGPGCQGHWKTGDLAMALLPGGGQAQYVTVPEDLLMPIPEGLTLSQAAAIPEAWITAFQLLHLVGNVQVGDYVLIHAGSSGVGTAAIQLARKAGAIPLVTAGSQHKLQMAEKLGAAAGFNYREDFSEATLRFTNGVGVDLILDCIGGSYWEKNVNCLALDGRWVLYGLIGGADVSGPLFSKLLFKRGSLITSLLRSRDNKYKQTLVKTFTEQILPYFSKDSPQRLLPVLDRVYQAADIQAAHEHMEANKNVGKIVLELPQ